MTWIIFTALLCSAAALEPVDVGPVDCTFQFTLCQWENGDESGLKWQHGSISDFVHSYRWPFLNYPPSGQNSQFMFLQKHPDRDALGQWVELRSPFIEVDGDRCLIFDYFNNMPNTELSDVSYGGLQLYARYLNNSNELIAHFRKSTSKAWLRAEIMLPLGEYRLFFRGYYNNDENTAMAIDDVGLLNTKCGEVVIDRVPGDCGFDTGNCGYEQIGKRPLLTYRKEELFDGEGSPYPPTGYFLSATYADYETNYREVTMQLQLPTINVATESCLYFSRFNSVGVPNNQLEQYNALNVKGTGPQGNFSEFIPKVFSDQWYGSLFFLKPGQHSIIFEAKVSNKFGRNDYVAIDAVEVIPQTCNVTVAKLNQRNQNPYACSTYKDRDLCLNGGKCVSRGLKTYVCECPEGYYGDRCQLLSPCHDNPCVHGKCELVGRKQYWCNCHEGFYNKYCNATAVCIKQPPEIENGTIVSITNTSYWGVVTYKCDDGFRMQGSNKSICRKGWTDPPTCVLIICGQIPTIANGHFQNDSLAQPGFNVLPTVAPYLPTLNSTVTVKCNDNYEYKDGDPMLRCGENGTWVGNVGKCIHKQVCGTPPDIKNGQLLQITSDNVGGSATYECNAGYVQIGVKEAYCMKNLQWLFLPQCVPHCPLFLSGQSGGHETVTVEITKCSNEDVHVTYPTSESCNDPVKHVVQKDDFKPNDNIRFYGKEVCFSVRTVKTASASVNYEHFELPDEVKCESFCLPYKDGSKRITIRERVDYTMSYDNSLRIYRDTIAFVTKGMGENE